VQELEKQTQALAATVQKVRNQLQPGSRSPQGVPEDLQELINSREKDRICWTNVCRSVHDGGNQLAA
jgi:hypothetical protein